MTNTQYRHNKRLWILLTLGLVASQLAFAEKNAEDSQALFATVAGESIAKIELNEAVNRRIRTTLYHAEPSAEQLTKLRESVGTELVMKTLLKKEAMQRGIEIDTAALEQSISRMEAYMEQRNQPFTEQDREFAHKFLVREQLVKQLEEQVKAIPEPQEAKVKAYYDEHPEKFTEPPQHRVSVILLSVAPSSTKEVWQAARKEAAAILEDINAGKSSFEDMARLRSSDPSAEKGGDMGYLHQGMLAASVDQLIGSLEVGQMSEPQMVLEGIAIFKVTDKKPPQLHEFEAVKERATDLYKKEQGEKKWNALTENLQSTNPVQYYQTSENNQSKGS